MPTQKKAQDIDVNAPPEILKGSYANGIRTSFNGQEVILDFVFIAPISDNTVHGELVSRVVVTPKFAKKVIDSISAKIDKLDKANK